MDIIYAIKRAGSEKELAKILGVTPQAVNYWKHRGRMSELQQFKLKQAKPRWHADWRRECAAALSDGTPDPAANLRAE